MERGDRDDIQVIRDELERLRADVHAARSEGERRRWSAGGRPRLVKALSRVGLVALMLALPVIVSASHTPFTDVPSSHSFHTVIGRVYGARLTTGCSPTRFCPSANVTRGQMAAFLARGLGRGGGTFGATGFDDEWAVFEDGVLDVVDLAHGGTSGGTGHVLVTASVSAYTDEADVCPCELGVALVNADTLEESPIMFQVIQNTPAPPHGDEPAWYETSANVSYLFTVPTGVTHTYLLAASMFTTAAPTTGNQAAAEWTISAVYVPFGATGGNPTTTTTQGGESRRGR